MLNCLPSLEMQARWSDEAAEKSDLVDTKGCLRCGGVTAEANHDGQMASVLRNMDGSRETDDALIDSKAGK